MRASQYTGLGIRTIMGNLVYPQVSPGITVSAAGVSVGGAVGSTAVSSTNAVWSVPAVSFTQGVVGNYSVLATGPGNYTAGGVYDVDVSGNPLSNPPFQLSEAGSLAYDGSGSATTVGGVVFGYTEPGALPTLTLHPTQSGTYPYMATAYPVEGAVPFGMEVVSPDDSTLRCSVLSRWPDNSAQVVVVAGRYVFPDAASRTIRLRAGTVSNTPLTTARIGQLVTEVAVNFGTPLSIGTFNAPDRVWWANAQVICARYRIPISNKGSMEAVIDIHAFAAPENRAFVEVVIENGKVNAASPTNPGSQTYTNATVSVNGGAPINGSGTTATHEAFRAWYCSAWVGNDPNVAVTHDTASMWNHPMLLKPARASSYNFATQTFDGFSQTTDKVNGVTQAYGSDSYVPFCVGRHRAPNMGAGGDHNSIGLFTSWEARYIQSGDKNVRNAVIQNALCALSFNYNYRDQTTTEVLDPDDMATRFRYSPTGSQADNLVNTNTEPAWEIAHQPEVGLIAFLCRPSPCFIELAQKVALWNCTYYVNNNIYYQTRSRAWGMRNVGHAIFLTPDSQAWKTGCRTAYAKNVTNVTNYFKNIATNPLGLVVDSSDPFVTDFVDHRSALGFQQSIWQHHFFAVVIHRASLGKILRGADQTLLDALADWACAQPIRYVNEMPNGAWRYHRYETTIGVNQYGSAVDGAPMGQLADWWSMTDWWMSDTPATVTGPWYVNGNGDDPPDQSFASGTFTVNTVATTQLNYVEHFWMALCAGVERNISGADTAWTTVYGTAGDGGVTNMVTWLNGFAADARQGHFPRNK